MTYLAVMTAFMGRNALWWCVGEVGAAFPLNITLPGSGEIQILGALALALHSASSGLEICHCLSAQTLPRVIPEHVGPKAKNKDKSQPLTCRLEPAHINVN